MTPDRWQQIEQIFNDAVALAASDRAAWLLAACGDDDDLHEQVERLLAADADQSAVALGGGVQDTLLAFAGHVVPRRLGPYELLAEVGSGGMGTVYKAHRVDREYDSIVAIKLVRPGVAGDAIVLRFRQERQILARLTHPSIARLLDGGTTADGIPYIVMEYIEGAWITDHCRAHQLDLRARLELFLPVCAAVDHAHQHFIVHRDIKPNNILIDRTGTPKLLDFGISKLLHVDGREPEPPLTQGMTILTPHYASPEQVLGELITIKSDVYSLGAVLYEILTGVRAHRFEGATPRAIEDAICRDDVPLASAVAKDQRFARKLTGDLDNIVMRAMHKDPERRYASAAALADDIRRYLDDLPVLARPDTTLYRARKFVRRNRALVAGTLAVLTTLMVGAGVALRQAHVAGTREHQVRGLAKTFIFDVHDSIKDLPGATTARQKIVTTAVRYLDALAGSNPSEPELLRELAAGYTRVGDIQGGDQRGANLGDPTAARASYGKALTHLNTLLATVPADREALIDRVIVQQQLAELTERVDGVTRAHAAVTDVVASAHDLLRHYPNDARVSEVAAGALLTGSRVARLGNSLPESLALATESLRLVDGLAAAHPSDGATLDTLATTEAAVGMTQARLGKLADALSHYRRAVTVDEALYQLQPTNVAARRSLMLAYSHVGDLLGHPSLPNLDDPAGAEQAYTRMTAIAKELYDADSHDARGVMDYGLSSMRLGLVIPQSRSTERLEQLHRGETLLESLLQKSPKNATVQVNLGFLELVLADTLVATGRPVDATPHYQRAFDLTAPLVDRGNAAPAGTFIGASRALALARADGGQQDAALALLQRALAVAVKEASRESDDDGLNRRMSPPMVYAGFYQVHRRLGHREEAAEWRSKALSGWNELSDTMIASGWRSFLRREIQRLDVTPKELALAVAK